MTYSVYYLTSAPLFRYTRFERIYILSVNVSILLDAHLDIAMNYVAYGRELGIPSWRKHQLEGKAPGTAYDGVGVAVVGLPDLLLGRVGIVFGTLWVQPKGAPFDAPPILEYETPQQAYQKALRQLDYYQRLHDEDDRVCLLRTQHDLETVLASWAENKSLPDRKLGILISMEGADPILEPKQVEEWYERGVRAVGLAWMATRYSAGTGEPGKLSSLGWALLEVMASFNMILDLSHMAEDAYLEAVDHYPGILIASHSNPRKFVNTDRHLSDVMIRRLAERDGVMGVVAYNAFLKQGWRTGRDRKDEVSAAILLDAIDHVCQVTGSARHVGIGTDWDGGFGWESIPTPFDSHVDLWQLRDWLARRGYSPEDTDNILAGNFLRILKQSLPDTL